MNLRPLRPEIPAAPTMLVAEHGRVPYIPAGWQIAVVVLRYFVAVLIRHPVARNRGGVRPRHLRVWGLVGLKPRNYGFRGPTHKIRVLKFRFSAPQVVKIELSRTGQSSVAIDRDFTVTMQ